MSHQSLYRKYRPATFEEVVGQKHIERTLKNAVATDSVAHAYLFSGPRGTGKTTTARILASALVCGHTKDGEPDGTCEQCLLVGEGRHPDVIELDAASRTGVDNVREEIINNMQLATVRGGAKVYIIDEVHMLSKGAFNAMLKTLEEPPAHVVFILCTTDPQKVPGTIRSRCQEFDFHPVGVGDMVGRLQFIADSEGIKVEGQAVEMLARHADGGMRDGITLLEQMAAFSGGNITAADVEASLGGIGSDALARVMKALAQRDAPACFIWVAQQVAGGADLVEVTRAVLDYARDLYVVAVLGPSNEHVNRSGDDLANLNSIAELFDGPEHIARLLDLLFDLSDKLRWSTEPRILVELTLARATSPQGDLTLEALAERIERLERGNGESGRSVTVEASFESAPSVSETEQDEVPSSSPSTDTDPASLRRSWNAVLAEVRKRSASRHPLFADSFLNSDTTGEALVVEWTAKDSFKYNRAKQAENRELLTDAVAATYGKELPIEFKLGKASSELVPHISSDNSVVPASEPEPQPEDPRPEISLQATEPPAEPKEQKREVSSLLDDLGATVIATRKDTAQ